jgi:hypothetical protein
VCASACALQSAAKSFVASNLSRNAYSYKPPRIRCWTFTESHESSDASIHPLSFVQGLSRQCSDSLRLNIILFFVALNRPGGLGAPQVIRANFKFWGLNQSRAFRVSAQAPVQEHGGVMKMHLVAREQ